METIKIVGVRDIGLLILVHLATAYILSRKHTVRHFFSIEFLCCPCHCCNLSPIWLRFSIKILYQQEDKKNANDPQINKMTQLMARRCARKIVNQKASFSFTWGFSSTLSTATWLPLMNVERIHFWSELLFYFDESFNNLWRVHVIK